MARKEREDREECRDGVDPLTTSKLWAPHPELGVVVGFFVLSKPKAWLGQGVEQMSRLNGSVHLALEPPTALAPQYQTF